LKKCNNWHIPCNVEGEGEGFVLMASIKMTLTILMIMFAGVFGTALVAPDTAEAWPTKYSSCTSCHADTDPDANIYVAIDGTETTSISVDAGSSFEIDYYFTNATDAAGPYGVGVQVVFPDGWTIAAGTSNSPTITGGWDTAWDATDGVGWTAFYDTDGQYSGTSGVAVDYAGSSWDYDGAGTRNAACDDGGACTNGTDLDGSTETMGADASVTVNPATTPGVYTMYVFGIGHDSSSRTHVVQSISVTVSDPAGQPSRNPGTSAVDTSNGGTATWGSPGESAFQDNTYASLSNAQSETSYYLKSTNFGFSIPGSATIDGIVVEIDRYSDIASMVTDAEVKIVKGGTVGSQNKAAGGYWGSSDTDTYQSYGGSSDLWNATWSPSDINDSGFGVVVSASVGGTKSNIFIDDIRITVHYTPGPNTTPDDPASLAQYKLDGTTVITQGSTTDEASIIIKASVDDTDSDNVSIEAEAVLNGGSFTGTANCTGGSSVAVAGTAQVTCSGLSDLSDYKWRVRAYDGTDYSSWVTYGGNPDVSIFLSVNHAPTAPSDHAQYKSDTTTGITQGTYTDEGTVVFKATVSDPDSDTTKLEVEIVDVDASFTDTATCSSGYVTSGTVATATCSSLADGVYKWQARTNDGTATSSWTGY
jgi:hypothetical protein